MRFATLLTLIIIVISVFLFGAAVFSYDGSAYRYRPGHSYTGGFFYWGGPVGYYPGGSTGTYAGGRTVGGSFRGGGTGIGK